VTNRLAGTKVRLVSHKEGSPTTTFVPDGSFVTTHWSRVIAAGDRACPQSAEALEELCRDYRPPLFAYIRRRGYRLEEAEDLTQAFFERFLAKDYLGQVTPGKGRFRSFLLVCLKNFLANQWDHAHRQKRGGERTVISLDASPYEDDYSLEPRDELTSDIVFERRWALTVLEKVLEQLRAEFQNSERADFFHELKPFLQGATESVSYAQIAARVGLTEGALRVAVHRLRKRYGELLRAEIARTVADPGEIEEEIRHLIWVLGQ
jgi:RNA polymerase sigma factor (sigma-70 family)